MSWVDDVVKLGGGEAIAVDGKTHRRSHDHKKGVKAALELGLGRGSSHSASRVVHLRNV